MQLLYMYVFGIWKIGLFSVDERKIHTVCFIRDKMRLVEKLKKVRDKTSLLHHAKGQKSLLACLLACWTVVENVNYFFLPHAVKELVWDKLTIFTLKLQLC